jgi:hypothetical protein
MDVIINAKSEDEASGQQNRKQSPQGKAEVRGKMMPSGWQCDRKSQKEREKNRNPAKSRQGTIMQVALQGGRCHPSARSRKIAHVPGQNKRKQQRPRKCPEVEKCQLSPLSKVKMRENRLVLCRVFFRCIDVAVNPMKSYNHQHRDTILSFDTSWAVDCQAPEWMLFAI